MSPDHASDRGGHQRHGRTLPVDSDETAGSRPPRSSFDKPLPGSPEAARQHCLRLLSVRPRTYDELAKALQRKDFADDVISEVLERYADVGMIDDQVFARAWVTSRHRSRGLARRALASELRRKGVEPEHIDEALQEVTDEDEREAARDLVQRRLRPMRDKPHDVIVRRLVGQLARKGYAAGLAFSVVKEVLDADPDASEASALIDPDVNEDWQGPL